jgi:hypothetical protein
LSRKKKEAKKAKKLEIQEDVLNEEIEERHELKEYINDQLICSEEDCNNVAMKSTGICTECYMKISYECSRNITEEDSQPLKLNDCLSRRLSILIGDEQ